jgi:hypothetical protein
MNHLINNQTSSEWRSGMNASPAARVSQAKAVGEPSLFFHVFSVAKTL